MSGETQFTTIQGSAAHESLQQLGRIPGPKELTLASIFNAVKPQVGQVQHDILNISNAINGDIETEFKQTDQLDMKLKKSFRHITRSYSKITNLRQQHANYEHRSKYLDRLQNGIIQVEQQLKSVSEISDHIIDNFIDVNNRFENTVHHSINYSNNTQGYSPLISIDSFSKQHYPLLFSILQKKCNDLQIKNRADKNHLQRHSTQSSSDYNISSATHGTIPNDAILRPRFLDTKTKPSVQTTFENITSNFEDISDVNSISHLYSIYDT